MEAEVGTCAAMIAAQPRGATILLAMVLAPQLFVSGCADACAASILAILSAIQILRLGMIAFQSKVIKVQKKKHLRGT